MANCRKCGLTMPNIPSSMDYSKVQCQECFWATCKVGGHFELTRGQVMDRSGGTTIGSEKKPGWGGK